MSIRQHKVPYGYYELKDAFEDGSFSGWTAYPMVQDYGYNPFLAVKKEIIAGKESHILWCKAQASYSGTVRLGFIKKVRFLINKDSSVEFKYHLKSYESIKQIRCCFVSASGDYIGHVQRNPWKDTWRHFRFNLQERLGSDDPVDILSLFIEAEIPSLHVGESYELRISEVCVKGLRPYEPILSEPEYKEHPQHEEAYILKTYRPDDKLNMAVDVPCPVKKYVNRIAVKSISPSGRVVYGQEFQYKGNLLRKAVKIFDKGESGFWKLEISGKDNAENIILTKNYAILQIIRELKSDKSPILYFDEKARKEITQHLKNRRLAETFGYLKKRAEMTRGKVAVSKQVDIEKFDNEYLGYGLGRYFELIVPVAEMIWLNAFFYFVESDKEAFNAVKKALLSMSLWKEFQHPWIPKHGQFIYYPVGEAGQRFAFGYDIIADKLRPDERRKIARFFLNTFVIPAYREYYWHDRIPAKTSNWEAHILSGAILCALVILKDLGEKKVMPYLIPLIQTFRRFAGEYFLQEGCSVESIGYLAMTFNSIANLIPALKKVLNIDLANTAEQSLKYAAYCSKLNCSFARLDYGDLGPYPERLVGLAYFVKKSSNPTTRLLWQNYRDDKDLRNIIWHTSDKRVYPEKVLPLEAFFSKKGIFISRSGWDRDCLFFSFHCGPYYNHAYADNGSFCLYYKGDLLIEEGGLGFHDYYDNPYYNPYFTRAIGHNTLLVGNNPASQKFAEWPTSSLGLKNFPRITEQLSDKKMNFICGDLSSIYDDLASYQRIIIQIKPHDLFIVDRVSSCNKKKVAYSQIYHAGETTESAIINNRIKIRGKKSQLVITPICPAGMSLEKRLGHIPHYDYQRYSAAELRKRYYFQITTPGKEAKSLLVSHLGLYDHGGEEDVSSSWQMPKMTAGIGLKKIKGKNRITVCFAQADSGMIKGADVESDAKACVIFDDINEASPSEVFFYQATYLVYKGEKIVVGKRPATGFTIK